MIWPRSVSQVLLLLSTFQNNTYMQLVENVRKILWLAFKSQKLFQLSHEQCPIKLFLDGAIAGVLLFNSYIFNAVQNAQTCRWF